MTGRPRNSQSEAGGLWANVIVGLVRGVAGQVFESMNFYPVSHIKLHAKPGDLLEFHRGFFSHYALYLGHGKVMNIGAETMNTKEALISEMTIEDVCRDSKVRIRNHDDVARNIFQASPRSVFEIIRSAQSFQNKIVPYEFHFRNCEYYASLWRYGAGFSTQVVKPTSTPPGSVVGEVLASGEASRAIVDAVDAFQEAGGYAQYKRLATMQCHFG